VVISYFTLRLKFFCSIIESHLRKKAHKLGQSLDWIRVQFSGFWYVTGRPTRAIDFSKIIARIPSDIFFVQPSASSQWSRGFVEIDELGRCRAAGRHSSEDAALSRDTHIEPPQEGIAPPDCFQHRSQSAPGLFTLQISSLRAVDRSRTQLSASAGELASRPSKSLGHYIGPCQEESPGMKDPEDS